MLGLTEVTAALQGRPVQEGPKGALVVPGIDPDGLHEAWRSAHALLPVTGRWPILVTTDWDEDVVAPSPFDDEAQTALAALDHAARTVDPWLHYRRDDDEDPEVESSFYTEGFYGVDVTAHVQPAIGPGAGAQQVLRAAYDHVLSDPELTGRVRERTRNAVSTDFWFKPDEVSLLLLPTASPWLAPFWVDFYGALHGIDDFAAALWQWHRRWDVRLVASWDTMLQFEVHRPPVPGDDAWTAARQLLALGPDFDIHEWELAVAVTSGDAWFVHNRP
ncbi:DUF4253 domain-containing protein [Winogradskya humida]|uniref:DUF4253 domain-containing protein n=1 Tax=Winogradskya humida TaxID=113566 RepID=A0ABQ3ZZE1_9ACTN|nr:DUF4253 domain-containing protein [Actinoplanes humidus]GIE23738.1 hypothetical protein Ahu01nite_068400 [Actinoplanes humidus]